MDFYKRVLGEETSVRQWSLTEVFCFLDSGVKRAGFPSPMSFCTTPLLFVRCSEKELLLIFLIICFNRTQPVQIRHPGSVAPFRDIRVPKLLKEFRKIRKF